MEQFGPFQTTRRLDSGGGATVFEARKEGDAKGRYIVKLFAPERLVSEGGEEVPAELEGLFQDIGASFTSRVNLQKQASESSRFFAPILAGGHDERGAWYATQFYSRSVKGLLDLLVALEAPDVHRILSSALQAALHLKKIAGRSHGNLKPGNIFMAGAGKPRSSRVVVTDPMPGESGEAAIYEKADLRALGELLYQFVVKRKVDFDRVITPLDSSPDWTRLFGKKAPQWLEFCNRLLDPQLAPDGMSLERAAQDLARLRPPRQVLVPAVAALVIILLTVLAAHAWFGGLIIKSTPPGARITLNGEDWPKRTPDRIPWWRGVYRVELKLEQYEGETYSGSFFFRHTVIAKLKHSTGQLRIVLAEDAGPVDIFTNDQVALRIPSTPTTNELVLPTGEYRIAAKATAYPRQELPRALQIRRNQVYPQPFTFSPGSLQFTAEPPPDQAIMRGAGREVRGRIEGETISFLGLTPGRYDLELQKQWYQPYRESLQVEQGRKGEHTNVFLLRAAGSVIPTGDAPEVRFALLSVNGEPTNRILVAAQPNPVLSGTNRIWAQARPWRDQTNEVVVQPDASPSLAFVFPRTLVTISPPEPSDAVLTLTDSRGTNWARAAGQFALPPGTYTLKADRTGYAPEERAFTNYEGASAFSVALRPLQKSEGTLIVIAEPILAGASVLVRGPDTNRQTLPSTGRITFAVRPTNYTVVASYPGLQPISTNLAIARGSTNVIGLEFDYGVLNLTARVVDTNNVVTPATNADVFMDGRLIGKAPLTNFIVPGAASHTFTFNLAAPTGYVSPPLTTNFTRTQIIYLTRDFREKPKGPTLYTNSLGMEFVMVPGVGYVGSWVVSQKEYAAVMNTNPSASFTANDLNNPVNMVTAQDAEAFAQGLNSRDTGKPPGYSYRLPTEQEWIDFSGGLEAWDESSKNGRCQIGTTVMAPARVGGYTNRLGLYHVWGNVRQWTKQSPGVFKTKGLDYHMTANNRPQAPSLDPTQSGIVRKKLINPDPYNEIGFRLVLSDHSS